jgi:hypothetical protein
VRLAGGEIARRSARLWDRLPARWNHSSEDQRAAWVAAFFARQLGDSVLAVTCGSVQALQDSAISHQGGLANENL